MCIRDRSVSLIEESICKWFTQKLGFDESAGGIAASGGTLSNLNALVAARNHAGLESDPNAAFAEVMNDLVACSAFCTLALNLFICSEILGLPPMVFW